MTISGVAGAMSHREPAVDSGPGFDVMQLWAIALLCFGAGDVVTTTVGLRLGGVIEIQPLAARIFRYSTLAAMLSLKAAVFGGCYVLWRRVPEPHCVGVPLGLATLGVAVVTWNLHVLVLATVP
jgi:hypothetical protein